MAALTVQSINRAGAAPSYVACTGGGDTVVPGSNTFLHVKNGSGGALTVNLAIPAATAQFPNVPYTTPVAVSVPAAGERMIGPLPPQLFADSSISGSMNITYSGVTSLTIGAFNLSQP